MELVVFLIAGALAVIGAMGVVFSKHPVHSALSLVMTLFAVAVLFLNQDAQFLAAVQVIVYAGAIVVLFLFVIMLLGVDRAEDLSIEPIAGQRPAGIAMGIGVLVLTVIMIAVSADGVSGIADSETIDGVAVLVDSITGVEEGVEPGDYDSGEEANPNIDQLGRALFTDYVFAFEVTALLLTIAVVGAVMLTRKPTGELAELPDIPGRRPVSADDEAPSEELEDV